jgi:hypothetical protein
MRAAAVLLRNGQQEVVEWLFSIVAGVFRQMSVRSQRATTAGFAELGEIDRDAEMGDRAKHRC